MSACGDLQGASTRPYGSTTGSAITGVYEWQPAEVPDDDGERRVGARVRSACGRAGLVVTWSNRRCHSHVEVVLRRLPVPPPAFSEPDRPALAGSRPGAWRWPMPVHGRASDD